MWRMDKTFKFYSQILDNLIDSSDFWANFFLRPYSFETLPEDCGDNVEIHCGISRVALVADDCDEVIKFDISNAELCQTELNIYKAAAEEGLEQCFTAARYIGTYIRNVYIPVVDDLEQITYDYSGDDIDDVVRSCGHFEEGTICLPLYAYEKVSHYVYGSTKISEDENKFCKHTNSPLVERCSAVGIEIRRRWGDDIFWRLSDFCNAWSINDLHSGNVGWRGKDFVLMDYAGWHDEF